MKVIKNRRAWIVIGLVLICISFGLLVLHKNIVVTIDGQSQVYNTLAITVGQFIQSKGMALNPYDQINPSVDSWLRNHSAVEIRHASTIQVEVDGTSLVLFAVDPIPSELLLEADISIRPGDRLYSQNTILPMDQVFPTNNEYHFWKIKRSARITLNQEGTSLDLISNAATVGQALWEAGIRLKYGDSLDPPADTLVSTGMEITVKQARPVSIHAANRTVDLLSSADTVSKSLVDAGITLQGLDYTLPSENQPIPADGQVQLVRVTEDILIEQTQIPYETTYQPDPDLEIDRQTVLEAGKPGILARRVRFRYENGTEVSRNVEDEWLANPPSNQVIGYGTQILMRSVDTPDGTVNYWRALEVYAVSYKPSDTGGNITSTGQILKKGIIAVNPNYIPYGTVLYVPGYGYGVAADTGRLPPRMIDLGFTDEDFVGWHQNTIVYFVWPPPANITWIIP